MWQRRKARAGDETVGPVVCRWDLDKTYLLSEFDSLRELIKIPFEKAEDKVTAPGVAALIRQIRSYAERIGRPIEVYFVSASPPQIGREIRRKLELDGIVYEGIVFKDQLHRLMRGKFRHLREQVGYKLTELLKMRQATDPRAQEYLFGDDWESDPFIYSLYADVVAGRVEASELPRVLAPLRVDPPLVDQAQRLAREIVKTEAVDRIFINLERRTPPRDLRSMGSRLVPTFNYFQTAACLYERSMLDDAGIVNVAETFVTESGYTPQRLLNSLDDIVRRGHVRRETSWRVRSALAFAAIIPPQRVSLRERIERIVARLRATNGAPATHNEPPRIDYRALAAAGDAKREGMPV